MIEDGRRAPHRLDALTLGAWSLLLLYFYGSGRLNDYLAPGFRPWVLWAGATLGVMAAVLFIFGARCMSARMTGVNASSAPGNSGHALY